VNIKKMNATDMVRCIGQIRAVTKESGSEESNMDMVK